MDNSREPDRKRLRMTTDDQENTPPSTSHSFTDGLLAHYISEHKKELKKVCLLLIFVKLTFGTFSMGILEHKYGILQEHAAQLENENVQMKEIIEKQKADEEAKKSPEPLVLKKLFKLKEGNLWHGYSSLDVDEEPIEICLIDFEYLLINGVVAHPDKKLVLDGVLSSFDADPFQGNAGYYDNENDDETTSDLLTKVDFCNLTDLFLYGQMLSLNQFEKIASSGTIKKLFFDIVLIKDGKNGYITFENILQKLPNVEKFYINELFSVGKGSFKTLNKLIPFKKLQIFKLSSINYPDFDADSFFAFMKNHPNTLFTLSFCSFPLTEHKEVVKAELEIIKKKLLAHCPTPGKLEVKFE